MIIKTANRAILNSESIHYERNGFYYIGKYETSEYINKTAISRSLDEKSVINKLVLNANYS